ncbi:DUF4231 domain-containing protein [Streptomyces pharetrae]|uniref:DUF4231 domain-containing protein n=1 Tax=Streptomyces pharetrae TaxID=291370 RepID=UPI003363A395
MAEIRYDGLPALLRAADTNSLAGQRRFLRNTRIQLGALVAAAGFGMLNPAGGGAQVVALLAAVAFGAALISEVYLLKERPDRMWYGGRAVAESAKTLTWRYAVGGAPMGKRELGEDEAAALLLGRFRELTSDVRDIWLVPVGDEGREITPEMRRLRALSLAERKELYRSQRIDDQHNWYSAKSRWNQRRATCWSLVLAMIELFGLSAGIARAAGAVEIDLLGFAAALAAAGAAWVQAKQHQTLATAYAMARHEIACIRERMDTVGTEEAWATFVSDAEEAFSREHTMWRASHGG